jgi:hypothetical protein
VFHCDKVNPDVDLCCGPNCILHSVQTARGSTGIVCAELNMYKEALSLGSTHSVLVSETCVPVFRKVDLFRDLLGTRSWMSYLTEPEISSMSDAENADPRVYATCREHGEKRCGEVP